jgi:hypothetical protein
MTINYTASGPDLHFRINDKRDPGGINRHVSEGNAWKQSKGRSGQAKATPDS